MRTLTASFVLVLLSASLAAQFPIGHATPIGPYYPVLSAEPLWLGNTGFGYGIQGAPPGGSAFVAVSAARQDQVISGLSVYVDLASIVITHGGAVDASGHAFLPVPLGGPDIPALAGVQVYVQAAVSDPLTLGSFGATQGLLLELTLHPVLALMQTTHVSLLDPVTSTATPVTGFPPGTTVADEVFGNGGRDLFLATNDGVFVVDTLAAAPTALYLPGAPSFVNSLAWDRVHRRLYALSTYNNLLTIFDGDRGSPSFGTTITQITPSGFSTLHVAISPDGEVLALVGNSGSLDRRNGNPASPGYLLSIPTPPSSVTLTFGSSVKRPHVSPDGRVVSIPVQHLIGPSTEIHRFDGVTGQWIDYAPAVAGYQPLSFGAVLTMFPCRDGRTIVLTGGGSVRLDLDLADPANVVATALPLPPQTAFGPTYISLTPSGRFLVLSEFPFFGPGTVSVSLVDVATGVVTPWFTPPIIPGDSSQGWR